MRSAVMRSSPDDELPHAGFDLDLSFVCGGALRTRRAVCSVADRSRALPDLLEEERPAIFAGDTERAVELARETLARHADVLARIDDGFGAGLREVRSLVGEER